MQGYNLILIYNPSGEKMLMCKRAKEPYKGLCNVVGGKIEPGETGLAAAYRELYEETGITEEDVTLYHFMDLTYYASDLYLEVYVGRLRCPVTLTPEKNELLWVELTENFFDTSRYAGEGNLGHIVEQVRIYQDRVLAVTP